MNLRPLFNTSLLLSPRPGEPSDEVRLRGEPKIVAKLKAELEKVATTLRDRIILGVEVPAAQRRALIGRGGQHLNDLQGRTNIQVQFPGSRSYHSIGEPENSEDLLGVDPANLVKVSGPRAACEKAVEELKVGAYLWIAEGVFILKGPSRVLSNHLKLRRLFLLSRFP